MDKMTPQEVIQIILHRNGIDGGEARKMASCIESLVAERDDLEKLAALAEANAAALRDVVELTVDALKNDECGGDCGFLTALEEALKVNDAGDAFINEFNELKLKVAACTCQREYTPEKHAAIAKDIKLYWERGEVCAVDPEQCFDCTSRKAGCCK